MHLALVVCILQTKDDVTTHYKKWSRFFAKIDIADCYVATDY